MGALVGGKMQLPIDGQPERTIIDRDRKIITKANGSGSEILDLFGGYVADADVSS